MVATDAISAFDHVIRTPIPDKGRVLTQLSVWFDQLADIVPNHVVSDDVPEQVAGRALVTEKLEMIPVECVARGYLTGSGGPSTQDQSVCGIPLQPGLRDGDRPGADLHARSEGAGGSTTRTSASSTSSSCTGWRPRPS